MEPSPAPHEGPAKAEDNEPTASEASRFKALTRRLFAVDQKAFREAYRKHAKERPAKRKA